MIGVMANVFDDLDKLLAPKAADYVDLSDKVESFQNLLIAGATGGSADAVQYFKLRKELLEDGTVGKLMPRWVRTCRDTAQFWQFIKYKLPSYAERRKFIWDELRPALEAAEGRRTPVDDAAEQVLSRFNAEAVQEIWQKALARREKDPDGAITSARQLLEAVCKHVLDRANIKYETAEKLPKLYKLTADHLKLAPSQHTEETFKRILGGCTSVVEGLGSIRSKLGDAHGGGANHVKPKPRHAELAVNLAGTMASFIVATWEARESEKKK